MRVVRRFLSAFVILLGGFLFPPLILVLRMMSAGRRDNWSWWQFFSVFALWLGLIATIRDLAFLSWLLAVAFVVLDIAGIYRKPPYFSD